MKKLIPALCMLLIAAAMLGTSTYAWFSMNKTVTATGMSVTATTAGSLVIDTSDNMANTTTITKATTVAATTDMYPSIQGGSGASTLQYVTNTDDVDTTTGFKKTGGPDLVYANVETDTSGHKYFVDHTFYVASAGAELTNQKLTFKLTDITGITAGKDIVKAFKVIVLVNDTVKGTLSLNHTADTVESDLTGDKVPQAAASGNIKVTFRVYLDGEEKVGGESDDKDYAIVRNINSVDAATATFSVAINAVSVTP